MRVCSNHVIEYIQDYPTLNLGYDAKLKIKLLDPAVAGSKRSLTNICNANNLTQPVWRNTKHEMPKQDHLDLCNSSSGSVLSNFKNLFLPPTSTPLIKRSKNAHNLENTNNNYISQYFLETDTDLKIMSIDEAIQRIKQKHVKTNTFMLILKLQV